MSVDVGNPAAYCIPFFKKPSTGNGRRCDTVGTTFYIYSDLQLLQPLSLFPKFLLSSDYSLKDKMPFG